MPRMIKESGSVPTRGTFVGRASELRSYRNSTRYLLGHETPPGDSDLYPHIFLIYGEGGMGKSALLQQFKHVALEEGLSADRIIVIDLDYQMFPTVESLAQKLVQDIQQQQPGFGQRYRRVQARRDGLWERYHKLQTQWVVLSSMSEKEIDELLATHTNTIKHLSLQEAEFGKLYTPPYIARQKEWASEQLSSILAFRQEHKRLPQTFDELLQREFGVEDASLFLNESGLGQALADDLYELAEASPLLLAIDTYERADMHDDWLRVSILENSSDRMLTIIAGRNKLVSDYRRTFSGDNTSLVLAIDLNELILQADEIQQYLKKRLNLTDDPPQDLIAEIQDISRGVPLALEALVGHLAAYGDIAPYRGMKFNKQLDRRGVVRTVTNRFLRYALDDKRDDQSTRERKLRDRQSIRALSLLLQPDEPLACVLWGISIKEGQAHVNNLANRYSFIFAGYGPYEMHDLVRDFIRENTRTEGRQTFDWPALEQGLHRVIPIIKERIAQAERSIFEIQSDSAGRYDDRYEHEDWRQAILDYLNALLWLGIDGAAFVLLINRWIEAQYESHPYADELATLAIELAPKTTTWKKLIHRLRSGEDEYGFFEEYHSQLEPHARAVLYYLRGTEVSVWSVTDSDDLKTVTRKIELLEKGYAIEKTWAPLREELAEAYYRRAAYYFDSVADYRKSFDDCNRSLELRPDNAASLTGRGAARAKLGDDKGALADWDRSLELRPDHTDTLVNRANTRQTMGDYKGALEDFDRLLELDSDNTEALIERGTTKQSLGDHLGAQNDYNRALVLLSSDEGDAEMLANRGNLKRAMEDLKGALDDYDRSLELRPDDAGMLASRGLTRQAMGDIEGALADYDRSLELRPDDPVVLSNRGNAKLALADSVGAQEDYTRSLQLLSDDGITPDMLTIRGDIKHNMGNLEGALADYNRSLELRADDAGALANRAFTRQMTGDIEGALADYDRSLELRPDDPITLVRRSSVKQILGDSEGSLADSSHALELLPGERKDPDTLVHRGMAKTNLGDITGALADYTDALQLRPNDLGILANCSIAKISLGDIKGALADCSHALTLYPDDPDLRAIKGLINHSLGNIQDALTDYNFVLQLNPDHPDMLMNRGNAKQTLGNYEDALVDYESAFKVRPEDPLILFNRGNVKQTLGNYEDALVDYNRSLQLLPRLLDPFIRLCVHGMISANTGNYVEARDYLERASRLRPGNLEFLSSRAFVKYKLGDYSQALQDIERVQAACPDNLDVLNNSAAVRYRLGNYTEALQDTEHVLKVLPSNVIALSMRGLIRYKLGDTTRAFDDLRVALQLRPRLPGSLYNMACLYALHGQPDEALAWLKKAIMIYPPFCKDVLIDDHFNLLRDHLEFMKTISMSGEN